MNMLPTCRQVYLGLPKSLLQSSLLLVFTAQRSGVEQQQVRYFSHPKWNKKTRRHFKPTYFDNVNYEQDRRWDAKQRRFRYVTQDPLFFDYERLYINGGIQPYLDRVRALGRTDIPLNKRAYILYHIAK